MTWLASKFHILIIPSLVLGRSLAIWNIEQCSSNEHGKKKKVNHSTFLYTSARQ